MTDGSYARRYPASLFPGIHAVRLMPLGASATLVNMSATGILVESEARLAPGAPVRIDFEGTFSPTSIESRVTRSEVARIHPDGSLRFHLGLAFGDRIALSIDAPAPAEASGAVASGAASGAQVPALRNRW